MIYYDTARAASSMANYAAGITAAASRESFECDALRAVYLQLHWWWLVLLNDSRQLNGATAQMLLARKTLIKQRWQLRLLSVLNSPYSTDVVIFRRHFVRLVAR